jgi:hypothetical protein
VSSESEPVHSSPDGGQAKPSRRTFVRKAGTLLFVAAVVDLAPVTAMAVPPPCGNGNPDSNCGANPPGGGVTQDNNCGSAPQNGKDQACGKVDPDAHCGTYNAGGTLIPFSDASCGINIPVSPYVEADNVNTRRN